MLKVPSETSFLDSADANVILCFAISPLIFSRFVLGCFDFTIFVIIFVTSPSPSAPKTASPWITPVFGTSFETIFLYLLKFFR